MSSIRNDHDELAVATAPYCQEFGQPLSVLAIPVIRTVSASAPRASLSPVKILASKNPAPPVSKKPIPSSRYQIPVECSVADVAVAPVLPVSFTAPVVVIARVEARAVPFQFAMSELAGGSDVGILKAN